MRVRVVREPVAAARPGRRRSDRRRQADPYNVVSDALIDANAVPMQAWLQEPRLDRSTSLPRALIVCSLLAACSTTTGAPGTTGSSGTTGAGGTTATAGTAGGAGATGSAGTTGAAGAVGNGGRGGTTGMGGRGGTTGTAGRGGAGGAGGGTVHDRCANPERVELVDGQVVISGNTAVASDEFPTLDCGGQGFAGPLNGRQLYYRFTARAGLKYEIRLQSTNYDPDIFYVFPAGAACTAEAVQAAC